MPAKHHTKVNTEKKKVKKKKKRFTSPARRPIHPMISDLRLPTPLHPLIKLFIPKHHPFRLQCPAHCRFQTSGVRIHTRQDPSSCQAPVLSVLHLFRHLRRGDDVDEKIRDWYEGIGLTNELLVERSNARFVGDDPKERELKCMGKIISGS